MGSPCDTLTGIATITKDKQLSLTVIPNPVTDGILHIRYVLPRNKAGTLTIRDITGKVVYTYRLPQWSTLQNLPLTLAEGMYFCTVASKEMSVTKKFVLVRKRWFEIWLVYNRMKYLLMLSLSLFSGIAAGNTRKASCGSVTREAL